MGGFCAFGKDAAAVLSELLKNDRIRDDGADHGQDERTVNVEAAPTGEGHLAAGHFLLE